MSNFWQVRNVTETEGELILYGNIASRKSWWDESNDGIYPRQFADDLKSLGNIKNLTVRINSNGGDVFAATAIYTQLKSHAASVTVVIDGIAASAATIIAMAGDTIKAPAAAQLMVHNPLLMLYGYYNSADLEKMNSVLETTKESILNAYANKTGKDKSELSQLMDKETWMTAEQARDAGFVDEILFDNTVETSVTNDNRFMVVNSVLHDMSRFESRPVFNQSPAPSIPVIPLIQNKKKERELPVEIKNAEDLKKQYPEFVNELINAAVTNAVTSERERIKAIEEISATVSPDLVNKAKFEEPMNAENLALMALKANANLGTSFLQDRQQEVQNNNTVNAQAAVDPKNEESKKIEAASIDMIAAAINAGRGNGGAQ